MKRYKSLDLIYRLKPKKLMKLLKTAKQKEFEETAWDYWLTIGIEAQKKTPFGQYLSELKNASFKSKSKDNRTDEEIIKDAEDILKLMKRT